VRFPRINSAESEFRPLECCAIVPNLLASRFFYFYKEIAGAIYPVIEDIHDFENNLELLLQNRTASGGVYREDADEAQNPFGVSIAYLGLLFSVLASGTQSSDLGSKERELTSQVYGMSYFLYQAEFFQADLWPSLLFLPVPPHDQLPFPTDNRSHPDTVSNW